MTSNVRVYDPPFAGAPTTTKELWALHQALAWFAANGYWTFIATQQRAGPCDILVMSIKSGEIFKLDVKFVGRGAGKQPVEPRHKKYETWLFDVYEDGGMEVRNADDVTIFEIQERGEGFPAQAKKRKPRQSKEDRFVNSLGDDASSDEATVS